MAAVTGCYKTSFINKILNYQPLLIRFALKLFVCKLLSFQTHLLLDLRFPLMVIRKTLTDTRHNSRFMRNRTDGTFQQQQQLLQ